jgi:hypothetical protein
MDMGQYTYTVHDTPEMPLSREDPGPVTGNPPPPHPSNNLAPVVQLCEPTHVSHQEAMATLSNDCSFSQRLNAMGDIVSVLVQKGFVNDRGDSHGVADKLNQLMSKHKLDPNSRLKQAIEVQVAAEEGKRRYADSLHKLLGNRDWTARTNDLEIPSDHQLSLRWESIWKGIKHTWDYSQQLRRSTPLPIAWYAARAEDILNGTMSEANTIAWIKTFADVKYRPCEVRMLLSAFLLRHVFMCPEPLCVAQYTEQQNILYKQVQFLGTFLLQFCSVRS